MMNVNRIQVDGIERKVALDRLLDGIGWGAFLIAIGILWLMPEGLIPHGSWLIALGVIMLAVNAARYLFGIEMNGFTLFAGIMAVFAGTGTALGVNLPLFPIALIVIGVCMLLVPKIENRSDSSTTDSWRCCR